MDNACSSLGASYTRERVSYWVQNTYEIFFHGGTVRQGNRTRDYQGQIHLMTEVDVEQQSQAL